MQECIRKYYSLSCNISLRSLLSELKTHHPFLCSKHNIFHGLVSLACILGTLCLKILDLRLVFEVDGNFQSHGVGRLINGHVNGLRS